MGNLGRHVHLPCPGLLGRAPDPVQSAARRRRSNLAPRFRRRFANVAIAAARQGASPGYLTSLGQDWMGDAFLDLWQSEGVDASRVSRHPSAPTGVSFVTHSDAGHKFDYLRKNSAASLMTPDALPKDYIAGARFFHLSAIGQAISESARQTCDTALSAARAAGVKVSYDTNLRLRLWDLEPAPRTIDATIARCAAALPSLDDSNQLTA